MEIIKTEAKYEVDVNFHDFGQKTFEQYQIEVIKASRAAYFSFGEANGGNGVSASASVRGETVRKALKYKIISGIDIKDIDDMKPYVIEWLANEIQSHVKHVTTAPADPNSSGQ